MRSQKPSFVREVRIRNYKSIGQARVALRPFSLLVGPNGSGKSNFLDALRFVADSLRTTIEHALRDRGGIHQVRRISRGHPRHFGIGVTLSWGEGETALYGFRVGAEPNGGFVVQEEKCRIHSSEFGGEDYFEAAEGKITSSSVKMREEIEADRLYLPIASAFPEFRPIYDGLSHMGFYNLNPARIQDLQDPDPGEVLKREGENIAAVIRRLGSEAPKVLQRISEYLQKVVPGIASVSPLSLGKKETIEIRQTVAGDENPWKFPGASMSDGTLRALGVLVAAFQGAGNGSRKHAIPLIGIEEPEMAIHPGSAIKLMDALIEASRTTQIVATTHSPDLLEHPKIDPDNILAVIARNGETLIAPIDEASRSSIREGLYNAGELLRMNQIQVDEKAYDASVSQLDLFEWKAAP